MLALAYKHVFWGHITIGLLSSLLVLCIFYGDGNATSVSLLLVAYILYVVKNVYRTRLLTDGNSSSLSSIGEKPAHGFNGAETTGHTELRRLIGSQGVWTVGCWFGVLKRIYAADSRRRTNVSKPDASNCNQTRSILSDVPLVGLCRRLHNMTYWFLLPVRTPKFSHSDFASSIWRVSDYSCTLITHFLLVCTDKEESLCVCDDFNPTSDWFCRPAYCPACHSLSHTHHNHTLPPWKWQGAHKPSLCVFGVVLLCTSPISSSLTTRTFIHVRVPVFSESSCLFMFEFKSTMGAAARLSHGGKTWSQINFIKLK